MSHHQVMYREMSAENGMEIEESTIEVDGKSSVDSSGYHDFLAFLQTPPGSPTMPSSRPLLVPHSGSDKNVHLTGATDEHEREPSTASVSSISSPSFLFEEDEDDSALPLSPANTMEGTLDDENQLLDSVSIEEPLCKYLGAFDGTKKEFDDIRPYFDDLFSDSMIHLMDGRHPIDKQTFAHCLNEHFLQQQMVATLEDIYFSDDTHVEYTVHWCNDSTSMVTHVVALVLDGKIVQLKPCEETRGAFANFCCKQQSRSGHHLTTRHNRLNQLMRLRGWARKG